MESAFDCVSRLQVITYYADTFDDQNSLSTVILITSIKNTIKKPKHIFQQVKWMNFWIANPTYQKTMATNKHEIK